MKSLYGHIGLLFVVLLHVIEACLPMDDVFKYSTLWMQPISVPSRHILTIGQDKHEEEIRVTAENGAFVSSYKCLKAYSQHRYYMRVQYPNRNVIFQCVKFIALTPQVVRMASTSSSELDGKLNCDELVYVEDATVLIAYLDIPTQPCPLQGGFQMLIRETNFHDDDRCMLLGWQENPSIQFECTKGKFVLAQFGKYCVPKVLSTAQKMRRRYLTHLKCVSSWQEPGKGNFVLFQMRDMYTTFWCMNYADDGSGDILSVYLTFDGRCTKKPELSDGASRHGHLVRYVPPTDPRCSSPPSSCDSFGGVLACSNSNECPQNCNRCLEKEKKSLCRFRLSSAGQWKAVVRPKDLIVDVDSSNFTMSDQGQFQCTGWEEKRLRAKGKIYPVVQHGSYPSCMPFRACSQLLSPHPGLFNFFLRPAVTLNGKIATCAETDDRFGYVIPVDQEKELTMVDETKLENTTCNVARRWTYPTKLGKCKFAIEECSGECKTLQVGQDPDTCGNQTLMKIETEHTCLARITFIGGQQGLVTKSIPKGYLRCWIFTKEYSVLRIADVKACNSQTVGHIMEFYKDDYKYDPTFALQDMAAASGHGSSYASRLSADLRWIGTQALLASLSVLYSISM